MQWIILRLASVLVSCCVGTPQQQGSFLDTPLTSQLTAPPLQTKRLIVPLNYILAYDGTPVVEAKLNNAVNARCMVDTGANNTLVSNTLAAKLRQSMPSAVNDTGSTVMPDGSTLPTMKVRLQLGQFVATGPFVVVPDAQLKLLVGNDADMILGMNILSVTSTLFDFQRHQITLYYPSALSEQELEAAGMQNSTLLPNVSNRNYAVYVDVTLNNTVQTSMMLDTGAPDTHLPAKILQPLHLKSSKRRTDFAGVAGDTHETSVIVEHFAMGPLLLTNREIFSPQSKSENKLTELGMDILTRYRILIDYPGKKVYFKPVEQISPTASIKPHSTVIPASATLPLEYVERAQVPFVRLTLEDNKPYLFQLDTSSTDCFLDRSLAEQAKFAVEEVQAEAGHKVAATHVHVRLSSQASSEAASVPQMQVPLLVQDLSDLRADYPGVAGILGANMLAQGAWQFDFGKKQVTFFLPGGLDAPQKPNDAIRLPLHVENGLLFVDGEIDGRKTRFLLSSVQDTQLRSPATLAALKPMGRLEFTKDAAGTIMPQGRVRLHTMQVGSLTWKQPVVAIKTGEAAMQPDILGLDFLHRYHVTIDVPANNLYLQPDPAYQEVPDSLVNIGVTTHITSEKDIAIYYLYLHSPAAEAGLQVGDVILSVNGVQANAATYAQVLELLHSPAGTELTLNIRRKGQDRLREIKLKTRKLL